MDGVLEEFINESNRRKQMIEKSAKTMLFHFNKKHLEDSTIPMWVLIFSGETFYVNHVDCQVPWSTKERLEHSSTKGAITIKDALITINDENEATITNLTEVDKTRLKNIERGITRV